MSPCTTYKRIQIRDVVYTLIVTGNSLMSILDNKTYTIDIDKM